MNQIRRFSPSQLIALTFVGLILAGALLLMLPIASTDGSSLSFVDALFTATSASCVTGLVVVDTGTYFSVFGQLVVIALIQLGGLGLVLFATLFSVVMRKKIDLQSRLNIQASLNQNELDGVVRMSLRIAKYTAAIEAFFGTVLALRFFPEYGLKGIYFGYWHAVSAFCNAGFDLFGHYQSLTAFVGDPVVNLSICLCIILGGLGFAVMRDVLKKRNFRQLKLHSKLVLTVTATLIVVGTAVIAFLEWHNPGTLGSLSGSDALWASFMQSVSPRTAGFNTIDMNALRIPTMIFIILLMFIGASPASTGGGIKTTTFALILLNISQVVRGRSECEIFGRRVGNDTIFQAFAITSMSILWVVSATLLVTCLEDTSFLYALFEVVSAFATVGLSTGLSQHICTASKIILILSMYAGRVGFMTFALALTAQKPEKHIHYPKENIIIG
ncbi:TrkH family potassium uptake protein [Acidaminococcus timonensis]|uniref:TrkH family potassium uptake protein n=1 Tax=Acidaminococcus timonensis TaxID=1871002 RepID=UPI0008DA57CD|nr:TrkH family potassium uptake protein [Acidaminococcus timonensis]MDD6569643.1 TrkH family potassium uptake protein [Acidaminococcus sp.]